MALTFSQCSTPGRGSVSFSITFSEALNESAQDGWLLQLVSNNDGSEPGVQMSDDTSSQLVFGIYVGGIKPG
ncbi:MAG TPA: hypothetical protein VIS49_12125 [Cyclobacteriaceae bacterium]